MADVVLRPGQTTLADWRAIYRGAGVTLDPACHAAVAAGARAVEAILARGEPVYGINTGFGRLASIRIEPADLATLQRNIVLSHAAGVGEPMPAPLVRLMLALKLASLGAGRLGRAAGNSAVPGCDVVARPVAGGADAGFRRRVRRSRAAWHTWRRR